VQRLVQLRAKQAGQTELKYASTRCTPGQHDKKAVAREISGDRGLVTVVSENGTAAFMAFAIGHTLPAPGQKKPRSGILDACPQKTETASITVDTSRAYMKGYYAPGLENPALMQG
jgi:hypothetical protein